MTQGNLKTLKHKPNTELSVGRRKKKKKRVPTVAVRDCRKTLTGYYRKNTNIAFINTWLLSLLAGRNTFKICLWRLLLNKTQKYITSITTRAKRLIYKTHLHNNWAKVDVGRLHDIIMPSSFPLLACSGISRVHTEDKSPEADINRSVLLDPVCRACCYV